MREGEKSAAARRFRKALTKAETRLWARLRREALGWRIRRQHPIGPYIADFACIDARVVIEVDGVTHRMPEEIAHDVRRTLYLERCGWRVVRVWNSDVTENMDVVLELIHATLVEHGEAVRRGLG